MILNYNRFRFVVPKKLDVIISSYGGSGTSLLLHFLGKHKSVNHVSDEGSLKHQFKPPLTFNPSQKFIYIIGNPVHATISLFRRELHYRHSLKIQKAMPGKTSPVPKEMTLQEYAKLGIDKFAMRNHFHNWYNSSMQNPIMFIKYESLYRNLDAIMTFAELKIDTLSGFPKEVDGPSG